MEDTTYLNLVSARAGENGAEDAASWLEAAELVLRIADSVDAMLGYWDRNLRCRFANAAYETWFGKTREELRGARMEDVLGPLFKPSYPHIQAALRGEIQMFEREALLPDGSVRQSLVWYFPDIRGGVVQGFFVQVTDVSALKQAEIERLREAMHIGRMYAFEWNALTDSVLRSGDAELLSKLRLGAGDTGDHFLSGVDPDDRERFRVEACGISADRPSYEISYRFLRDNDSVIWLKERGRGFFNANGKLQRVIGMTADITEAKETEESLRRLGGRLLSAQEEERKRIARELHDDIGQDLAIASMRTSIAKSTCTDERLLEQLKQLQAGLDRVGEKVRALSHQLHSATLEHVGLAGALQALCREFREGRTIQLSCACSVLPKTITPSISLALYRVAQEALRNVVKHAGATTVSVELTSDDEGMTLRIADDGAGFMPGGRSEMGLGLIGMRERIQSIGGQFAIHTHPGGGTMVTTRVKHPTAV